MVSDQAARPEFHVNEPVKSPAELVLFQGRAAKSDSTALQMN